MIAAIESSGWVAIITAVFLGLGQIVTIFMTHRTNKAVDGALDKVNAAKLLESGKLLDAVSEGRYAAGEMSQMPARRRRQQQQPRRRRRN